MNISQANIAHSTERISPNRPYQICNRCIMDTTDYDIVFDERGFCNHCTSALLRMEKQLLPDDIKHQALTKFVQRMKEENKENEFDCIIGVSGGVDSSTVAYWVGKLGLRALAVHFDNGWNTEAAVANINKLMEIPNIELFTYVMDWDEFRDIQIAFLKASVPNCEIPTDHAIFALLWKMARENNIRYILTGSNLATESIMPYSWGHYNQDLKHVKAIHSTFGTCAIRALPTISINQYIYDVFVRRIRQIPFLNYIDYCREDAKDILKKEMDWRDYGAKHYESVWTRFFQGYYLPMKFGFDKRRAHLSSLICAGQKTRAEALEEIREKPYDDSLLNIDMHFIIKKFGLTEESFRRILEAPPRKHTQFKSNYFLFHKLAKYKNLFRKIATTP